ncbi:MAG: Gfo/Idh/MocA family oxidoreductase, partial [Candidatus Brocadiia bacterium]
ELRWLEMAWQTFGPPGRWRGKAEKGGGRLFDLGTHMIDQVMQIFPQAVETVYCRMHHDYPDHDVDSHAMVVVGFEGGNTAVVDAGGMHLIPKPRVHAFGKQGTFVKHGLDPQESAMRRGEIDAAEEPEESYGRLKTADGEERVVPTVPGRWRNFYENVADVLAGRAEPEVKLSEARRVIAVLDAAFESAESGEVVRPHIPALQS